MDENMFDLWVKLAYHHLMDDDEMGVIAKTVLENYKKTDRHRWVDIDLKLREAENMPLIEGFTNDLNIRILDKKINKLIECLQLLNSGR